MDASAIMRVDSTDGVHVHVSVFMGRGTRAHCGTLTFRKDEFDELVTPRVRTNAFGDRLRDDAPELPGDRETAATLTFEVT